MITLSNFDELTKKSAEYHLTKIEEKMQSAFNQGSLYIYYSFPSLLIENEIFRGIIDNAIYNAGWYMEFHKNIRDDKFLKTVHNMDNFVRDVVENREEKVIAKEFKISCLEIEEEE